MAINEQNRNKNKEIKLKHYQENEKRWENKLKSIQAKIQQKNKESLEKARKYRQESELFWKSKEQKITSSRTHRNSQINTIPYFKKSFS